MVELAHLVPVYQSDGKKTSAGDVTGFIDFRMTYKGHVENIRLYITELGEKDVFLGMSWLKKHNPEIDWVKQEVKMTKCPPSCRVNAAIKRVVAGNCSSNQTARVEAGNCSSADDQSPSLPRVSTPEQAKSDSNVTAFESRTAHDLDTARPSMTEGTEELYEFTPEGERELPKEIRRLLIRETITKATEIAAKAQEGKKQQTFEEMVPAWLHDYHSVFETEGFEELPPRREWDHAIDLKEGTKPWGDARVIPLSSDERKALQEFLDENLKTGRIQPSKSPYASAFFFVKKKDGKLRPVQDYRKVNAMTIKNRTPLPLIKEVIDRLHGARVFSKMDVRWGFNNIRIKEGDEHKAAFITSKGLFEPTVMFFGLTNSPATFQTMMNAILRPVIVDRKSTRLNSRINLR